jgi:hypothetical protein
MGFSILLGQIQPIQAKQNIADACLAKLVLNQLFGLQSTTVSVPAADFNANILPNHNAIDLCLRLTH